MKGTVGAIPTEVWEWVVAEVGRPSSVSDPVGGSYNSNFVLELAGSPTVVLRVPKPNARVVDLRVLDEATVLRRLGPRSKFCPQLIATGPRGSLLVEHVGTALLDDVTERRGRLKAFELTHLTEALVELHSSTRDLKADYVRGLTTFQLAAEHTYLVNRNHLVHTWQQAWMRYERSLNSLGLPSPKQLAEILSADTDDREPGLLHGDVHRKNIRTDRGARRLYLIDWEMAQVGDPVYDIAVAVWKLKLPPDQEEELLKNWAAALPSTSTTGWQTAIAAYVRQETIKTACIHFVRALDKIRFGNDAHNSAVAIGYAANLQDARRFLPGVETDADRVLVQLEFSASTNARAE